MQFKWTEINPGDILVNQSIWRSPLAPATNHISFVISVRIQPGNQYGVDLTTLNQFGKLQKLRFTGYIGMSYGIIRNGTIIVHAIKP